MPTCSFMSKHGRVTFPTKPKKCKPQATTNTHKLGSDHRSKKKAAPASKSPAPMTNALPMNTPSARATRAANRARQRNLGASMNY